jgi:hypothetical protein
MFWPDCNYRSHNYPFVREFCKFWGTIYQMAVKPELGLLAQRYAPEDASAYTCWKFMSFRNFLLLNVLKLFTETWSSSACLVARYAGLHRVPQFPKFPCRGIQSLTRADLSSHTDIPFSKRSISRGSSLGTARVDFPSRCALSLPPEQAVS